MYKAQNLLHGDQFRQLAANWMLVIVGLILSQNRNGPISQTAAIQKAIDEKSLALRLDLKHDY
jgi:hypothetical protein